MLNFKKLMPRRRQYDTSFSKYENDEIKRMDTALCRMLNLRLAVDERLQKKERAEYWPLCQVWKTTEAFIVNVVEFTESLKGDGYTEEESIKKLLSSLSLPTESCAPNMRAYLQFRLKKVDPEYLSLGHEILEQAIALAKVGTNIEIQNRKSSSGFPPAQWLKEKLSYDELMDDSIYEHITDENYTSWAGTPIPVRKNPRYTLLPGDKHESRDWIRFQLRMRPDDEIWTFYGSLLGNGTSLSAGVALLRHGNVIDRVCTITG